MKTRNVQRSMSAGRGLLLVMAAALLLSSAFVVGASTADAQDEQPVEPLNNFWTALAATTACIDSPEVQDDPTAAGLSLGQTFVSNMGNRLSITIGGPTCSFDGSGCAAGLRTHVVADVKQCLADKAVAAAPAAAAAAPVAIPVTQLAHTGEEHERGAALAGALFGTGLSVLALARLYKRRD